MGMTIKLTNHWAAYNVQDAVVAVAGKVRNGADPWQWVERYCTSLAVVCCVTAIAL